MKLFISMYHYTRDLEHSRYPKIKLTIIPAQCQILYFTNALQIDQITIKTPRNTQRRRKSKKE